MTHERMTPPNDVVSVARPNNEDKMNIVIRMAMLCLYLRWEGKREIRTNNASGNRNTVIARAGLSNKRRERRTSVLLIL